MRQVTPWLVLTSFTSINNSHYKIFSGNGRYVNTLHLFSLSIFYYDIYQASFLVTVSSIPLCYAVKLKSHPSIVSYYFGRTMVCSGRQPANSVDKT